MRIAINKHTKPYLELCKRYGISEDNAARLRRIAIRLDRLNEKECNDSSYNDTDRALVAWLQAKAKQLVKDSPITLQFCSDPRGYSTRLMCPGGEYNTWGGKESGYGVPTEQE